MMRFRIKNIAFGVIILIFIGCFSYAAWDGGLIPKSKRLSVLMAESEMKRSPEGWMLDFSKKLKWNYCHGLVGKAFLDVYDQYGEVYLYNYMLQYTDTMIYDDGRIFGYKPYEYNIDRLNTGKILFRIIDKEGNKKYRLALEQLRSQLDKHPRTSEGGFWHKKIYPCQMWLDGLYMGAPFYAEYSKLNNDFAAFTDIANQFFLVKKYLYDEKSGLYRHGWDECGQQQWADTITGQSPHIWGRAVGWLSMALVDVLDFFPEDHPQRPFLVEMFANLAENVYKVQDKESGVWYQVLDQGNRAGNYLESSCSSMFVYSLFKGVRMGYLDESFLNVAVKGYQGIMDNFIRENADGTISITKGCAVAGLGGKPYRDGSYEYYIHELVRDNDPKAVGPFIMASLEYEGL